ncbi:sensor histidine kinase [Tropicimonas sp. S265A]|uniref:sensor histidine kinase n=1 Tax=Tropicimonas sp. S265A TaxID=3415134 RepID=UPI003C7D9D36
MTLWRRLQTVSRSLRTRLAVMLSLAVLPLGFIAVFQTTTVISDARALEERDLLAETVRAVDAQRALLRRSYGAADALGKAVRRVGPTSDECSEMLREFVDSDNPFSFAGFISADGLLTCASSGVGTDFSGRDDWVDLVANPRSTLVINEQGAVTGQSVVIATEPIFNADGTFFGALSLSMPHVVTDRLMARDLPGTIVALLDEQGNVLTASTGIDDAERFSAAGVVPAEMSIPREGATLRYTREDGETKLAALVPLRDYGVYVLGLWDETEVLMTPASWANAAAAFPILMWIASLAVAVFAVDRLALRHLDRLRSGMASFEPQHGSAVFVDLADAPIEFESIAETYNALIDKILADRLELQDTVQEKDLLLREVHHRVKNNLQLIASILNIQLRTVSDPGAKHVLRRVQDRVLSLSSIHKALYSGTTVATVRVDKLLHEVVQATLSVAVAGGKAIRSETLLDPLNMDPDRAVPLALLANELVTNAVKYVGRPNDGVPFIDVSLAVEGAHILFEVRNTIGAPLTDPVAEEGTGLGARLIDAFVSQLDGSMKAGETANGRHYAVTVSFTQHDDLADEDTDEDAAVEMEPA